ncbi:MAG: OmpA family protein [Candidatus Hydrogenedentes bacterium]|nr:OmpA family protein [Candidatus Hydrogenedentota bacterium]
MKRLIALALIAALCGFGGSAEAAKQWDDMSWWGNTGATPEPTADTKGRSGYWWWPKEPASNANDGELWGNRGIVYHSPWQKPMVEEETKPPAPPVEQQPAPSRTAIVLNNVLFDFDKSNLKPEGKAELDKLIAEMQKFPGDTVVVIGHTDSIGTDAYNMALGQRRADSVAAYLSANGIDASRIATKSMGESQPAVPNDTRANRALNRRAEFEITLGN